MSDDGPSTVRRAATEPEKAERSLAWQEWRDCFEGVRTLHCPPPPCWTCGGPPVGVFADGSPLYRHYHPKGEEPYVDIHSFEWAPTLQKESNT